MLTMNVYAYLGGAWVDITSDVDSAGVSGATGIPSNKETDRIAKPGVLNFTLKNNSGEYTPGHVAAHADWKKGTKIKVDFSYPTTYTKFIGYVDKINLQYAYNNDRAAVTALSWMHYASQLPLDIPALQTSKRGDQIVTTIVALSPIAPTATSYQTGTQTFPYAFHDNTVRTSAYTELSKVALSEWGYIYEKLDGTLVFEAYGGRVSSQKTVDVIDEVSGFLLKEDGDFLLQENGDKLILEPYDVTAGVNATATSLTDISLKYGEHMINRVVAEVYPYRPGEVPALLYKHEYPQYIPAGGSTSFRVQFTDAESRLPIAATTPSVKQYTLLHFDTPPDEGVTDVLDQADQEFIDMHTSLAFASGAVIDTSVKKFGTGSLALDGLSDYVYSKKTLEKYNFRNGDFTVDWWEYRLSSTANQTVVARAQTGSFPPFAFGRSDGTNIRAYITSNGSSWDIANAKNMGTITLNAWTHYAICRSGNTYYTFKNGVQQDTWTSSSSVYASTDLLSIGKFASTNFYYGYIDELRIIKGYAAYTAAFTPPIRQYTMDGVNWSVWTTNTFFSGTDISNDITFSVSTGGVGVDITATNAGGSNGYLNLQIFAPPLESLSPVSHTSEDATSISEYNGYFSEYIQMRLKEDVAHGKTIAAALIAAEKDPRNVLNKVSITTKDSIGTALFMGCDIGDLIRVTDSTSGYDGYNHIQHISWRAVPRSNGAFVMFDWTLKEQ